MARSDAEVVSQLPTYNAKRSKDYPSWLVVICPYQDCEEQFLVRASSWMRPKRRVSRRTGQPFTITGRSCPYCMRVGRVPPKRTLAA